MIEVLHSTPNTELTSKSIKCEQVGHLIQHCKQSRLKSRNPAPPKKNLEVGKPVHEPSLGQTTTSGQGLASAGGGAGVSIWIMVAVLPLGMMMLLVLLLPVVAVLLLGMMVLLMLLSIVILMSVASVIMTMMKLLSQVKLIKVCVLTINAEEDNGNTFDNLSVASLA